MRKIKGFKLVLRAHEIKRRAKKIRLELEALGLGQDPVLQKGLDEIASKIAPGVLFETFRHPDPDAERLSPVPGLAYSLILATLGQSFLAQREEALRDNPSAADFWSLIQETALDETVRFASSILGDEAAKDVCELSPLSPLLGHDVLETALRKLDGSKISLSLLDGALQPAPSVAVSLSWLSKSKAKGKSK